MSELVLFPGNSLQIELRSLRNSVTNLFISNATVRVDSIKDAATGATITGVSFPVVMNYVPKSRGNYRGKIPSSAAIVADHTYTLTISASDTAGSSARWSIDVPARVRDRS